MICVLIALIVVVVIGYIVRSTKKPNNYPPGPKWYPFIGCSNVLETLKKTHGSQWKALSYLAKLYSTQILGLKLGTEPVVVVYGKNNIRRVFTGMEFEGRPDSFFFRLRCLGKRNGITFSDGPLWRQHRQFTVKHLRNVGFGKTEMEKEIQNAMYGVLDYIKNNNNKSISPKRPLATAVMNVLWKYVAGEQIKREQLHNLLDLLNARSKAFTMAGGWLNQLPWSRFIIPERSGYALITKMNQQISDIIEEAISKHKCKTVKGNDFIYSFLEEMNESNKNAFSEEHLKVICLDLIIAGSQTSSNVVEFAILTMLRYKVIQEKIYDEIDNVIGTETPSWADSYRLTYTSAFLLEVQRYYNIVPLAGPRRVLEDVYLDGYFIPRDTTVLIAIGDLHFDPELWDDPHNFKPERFIDDSGKIKNTEQLYNFGLGRRRCPGDSLAKSFIFITFVGIIQKYRIECSNGILPSGEPVIGLISEAKPYTADFVPRY